MRHVYSLPRNHENPVRKQFQYHSDIEFKTLPVLADANLCLAGISESGRHQPRPGSYTETAFQHGLYLRRQNLQSKDRYQHKFSVLMRQEA